MAELKINNQQCFIFVEKNQDSIDTLLYDGKESWYESNSLANILERAKLSNRRIKYDEDTIINTIQNENPVEANWEIGGHDSECCLKLKYNVKSHPLYFTWKFVKHTQKEFQKLICGHLLSHVECLQKQNDELREIVIKKDNEIKQYKTEGAVLKRVTVATKPFNSIKFEEKYGEKKMLSKSFMKILGLLKIQFNEQTSLQDNNSSPKASVKNVIENNDVKLTPRRKRRKILEEHERIIAEKIKARGKPLEYESSQSEPLSTSSSEILDMDKTKNSNVNAAIQEQINLSPSISMRMRKEQSTKMVEKRSPRKMAKINYMEYENGQSSEENDKNEISPTKSDGSNVNISLKQSLSPCKETITPTKSFEKKLCISSKLSKSPPNVTNDHLTDIQTILDEWKELEQRRVADLSNMRTTRTGKRRSD